MATVIGSANVEYVLRATAARAALDLVLGGTHTSGPPDLVGLQEWHPPRAPLLRASGRVTTGGVPLGGRGPYRWLAPLVGGCTVGFRTARYDLVSARLHLLSRPGRADRGGRPAGLEVPRAAQEVLLHDRHGPDDGRLLCLVDYHLVSGVQAHDVYRADRPALVERHRHEVAALARVVRRRLEAGHDVVALGDSNFHGFELPGLVSAWAARPDGPGTLGPRRRIDDVFTTGGVRSVELIDTPSDHRAVVVTT
ncbi:hypothetical protein SAMN04489844_1553 [Nocardioides exalbidus]|uniref:Metal-dependent hydrolase, endonuclease/exonuclease/phosphatase family n=1 Tax=Nocardioides exalbidus TaxID=402596 RepID=A0A1H4P9S0_9ACTN|nr:hypothetical protein [Nocardioides exalbidus]SEC03722.1 hypothetical protein SAMN04489844_1553 [Nocardioides exalbidus]